MHHNAELIQNMLDTGRQDGFQATRQYYADDLTFLFPGRSALAGRYSKEEFFGKYDARVHELTNGRFEIVEVVDVLASDNRAALLVKERFERDGKEPLVVLRVALYRVRAGQICEFVVFDDDQYAVDDFYS